MVGNVARDREVPEVDVIVPYDPFKVDIFILGNLIFTELQDVRFANLFLEHHPRLTPL